MIRPCATLLVIGTLLPLATPARAQPSAASVLRRAAREGEGRRPRRQLAILRRGVARRPGHLELARALARALTPRDAAASQLDQAEALHAAEARAALGAVVVDDPQTRHLLDLQLAWLRALTGDCSGASADIARHDPRVDRAAALTLREIAALAIRRGELRVASVALDRARAADATLQGLDLSRAALAAARGQDERAVALLRARLERHPAEDPTRHALAGALLAAGRVDEALRLYRLRIQSCPAPQPCRRDWVRAALQARRFDLARDGARELLSSPSPEAANFTLLGLAEVGRGDLEAARRAFRDALRLDPEDARAQASLDALLSPGGAGSAPRESPAMLSP